MGPTPIGYCLRIPRFGGGSPAGTARVQGAEADQHGAAPALLITVDAGGSNGSRLRLWKRELQQLANHTGPSITVCHTPSGTSKWNKIEHRFFSFIAMNWRGRPLTCLATIVSPISATTTKSGLLIRSEIDSGTHPKGVTISNAQMASLSLDRHAFHGDWNIPFARSADPA